MCPCFLNDFDHLPLGRALRSIITFSWVLAGIPCAPSWAGAGILHLTVLGSDWPLSLQAYNIHVNGVLHCRVRYSQLLGLHEQVGRALGPTPGL